MLCSGAKPSLVGVGKPLATEVVNGPCSGQVEMIMTSIDSALPTNEI